MTNQEQNLLTSPGFSKTIHQLPNLGDCEKRPGGETRHRPQDSSTHFLRISNSTEPTAAHKECGWKQGKSVVGKAFRHSWTESIEYGAIKSGQALFPRLQAGGREPCAKQKAFGTAFATATSPASYLASKNPHCFMGGFFDAWAKCGRGEVEEGCYSLTH
jgi:hypothetical protein